jgi:hypothetical protein
MTTGVKSRWLAVHHVQRCFDETPVLHDLLDQAGSAIDAAAGRDAKDQFHGLGRFPGRSLRERRGRHAPRGAEYDSAADAEERSVHREHPRTNWS